MFTIAIHGGAGTILRELLSAEKEIIYHSALSDALNCGKVILENNGTSLEAVEACVVYLENCILFNAGTGSVFTNSGNHEMDASIMDGKNRMAGAVAGVSNVKNPIILAKTIMQNSEHVLLSGKGAYDFALLHKLQICTEQEIYTPHRFEQWLTALKEDSVVLDHSGLTEIEKKFGTVGAVAIDNFGNLSAATSTGGMTNKKFGRIGDTPIIGAGTYANNKTCAVSCTGHGEFFLRSVVAYDISCLMEYKGYSLEMACTEVVNNKLVDIGGEGGLIAVDSKGNYCLPFNSAGMYRGVCNSEGLFETLIYQ